MAVLWLGDAACHDPRVAGGKAANLSRLAAAYRVPPGFCLPAAAYDEAAASGLDLAGDDDAPEAVRLPEALEREVRAAYAALAVHCGVAQPAVAVRSSALDEDGRAASFAGQHDTYLNVAGADALGAAIVRCWRSLRAARALAYPRQRGLAAEGARLAVLVQQLVPAEAAGVLFSANPITHRRDEAVLTTSWGLGESLVGGRVTPDTYVVRKPDADGRGGPRIVARRLGDKRVMAVPVAGGTREVEAPAHLRARPAVDDAQVLEAVRLGMALEAALGWPVDVECAWEGGALYLLQCRPITTLR